MILGGRIEVVRTFLGLAEISLVQFDWRTRIYESRGARKSGIWVQGNESSSENLYFSISNREIEEVDTLSYFKF